MPIWSYLLSMFHVVLMGVGCCNHGESCFLYTWMKNLRMVRMCCFYLVVYYRFGCLTFCRSLVSGRVKSPWFIWFSCEFAIPTTENHTAYADSWRIHSRYAAVALFGDANHVLVSHPPQRRYLLCMFHVVLMGVYCSNHRESFFLCTQWENPGLVSWCFFIWWWIACLGVSHSVVLPLLAMSNHYGSCGSGASSPSRPQRTVPPMPIFKGSMVCMWLSRYLVV